MRILLAFVVLSFCASSAFAEGKRKPASSEGKYCRDHNGDKGAPDSLTVNEFKPQEMIQYTAELTDAGQLTKDECTGKFQKAKKAGGKWDHYANKSNGNNCS